MLMQINAYSVEMCLAVCVADRCSAFQLCTKPSSSISSTFKPVGDVTAVEYFLSSDTRSVALEIVNLSKCHMRMCYSLYGLVLTLPGQVICICVYSIRTCSSRITLYRKFLFNVEQIIGMDYA